MRRVRNRWFGWRAKGARLRNGAQQALGRAAILLSVAPASAFGSSATIRGGRADSLALNEPVLESRRRPGERASDRLRSPGTDTRRLDLGAQVPVSAFGRIRPSSGVALGLGAGNSPPPQRFSWRAPATGLYRLEFFPEGEPPPRYRLSVRDTGSGQELHSTETYGLSTSLPCEVGTQLEITVTALQDPGASGFELRVEDARAPE